MTSSLGPRAHGPSLFFAPFWKSRYAQSCHSTPPATSAGAISPMGADTELLNPSSTIPPQPEAGSSPLNAPEGQDARAEAESPFAACTARPRPLVPEGPAFGRTLSDPDCQGATRGYAESCAAASALYESGGSRLATPSYAVEPSAKRVQQSNSAYVRSKEARHLQEPNSWDDLSSSRTGATPLQTSTVLSEVAAEYPGAARARSPFSAPSSTTPQDKRFSCGATPYGSGRCWKGGAAAQEHQKQRVDGGSDMLVHPVLLQERRAGTPFGPRGVDLCLTKRSLLPLGMARRDGAPPKYDVPWQDPSAWGARERELQARVVHLQATLAADQAKRYIEAALALNQRRSQQPVIITNTTEVESTAHTAAVTAAPQSPTPKAGYVVTRTNEALARAAAWCEGFMGSKVSQWVFVGGSVWLFFWLRNRLQMAWRLQYIRKRNDASLLYRASCCLRSCFNSRTGRDVSLSFL